MSKHLTIPAIVSLTILGVNLAATAQIVYLENGGVVVGEGEHFSTRAAHTDGSIWKVAPDEVVGSDAAVSIANARGGQYIQVLPDDQTGAVGGGLLSTPDVQYRMAITTPGTYRLYLRLDGDLPSGNSDSMFADIVELKDGPGGTVPDHYEFAGGTPVNQNFASTPWEGSAGFEVNNAGGTPKTAANFTITPADIAANDGIFNLRFTMREDGAAVDAFVLQDSSLPAPGGFGPAVSLLQGQEEFATLSADADSYVRLGGGQNDQNFGNGADLLVKDSGGGSTTRKSYIRFDISSLEGDIIENAQLDLEVSVNNNGGSPQDPTPNNYTINVYGLNDGAGEDWVEGTGENPVVGPTPPNPITWDNAPANDTVDNDIDLSEAVFLGQFGVPALNPDLESDPIIVSFNNLMSESDDALLDFLANDTDGFVTFILTRDGGSNNLGFASSDNSTMMGPTLRVFGVEVPEPTSVAIWSVLGLFGIAGWRWRQRAKCNA